MLLKEDCTGQSSLRTITDSRLSVYSSAIVASIASQRTVLYCEAMARCQGTTQVGHGFPLAIYWAEQKLAANAGGCTVLFYLVAGYSWTSCVDRTCPVSDLVNLALTDLNFLCLGLKTPLSFSAD